MYLEVEPNDNCRDGVSMRFKELGPARRVRQVRLLDRPDGPTVCAVTGWCDDPNTPVCPAYACKVEESGIGQAYLVYGGNWGIRLKPADLDEDWNPASARQWGEAYLLLGSARDLVFDEG